MMDIYGPTTDRYTVVSDRPRAAVVPRKGLRQIKGEGDCHL